MISTRFKHLPIFFIALMSAALISCAAPSSQTKITKGSKTFSIENQYLKRSFSVESGSLKTTSIENKRAAKTLTPLSAAEFQLRISQGTYKVGTDKILTSSDFKFVRASEEGGTTSSCSIKSMVSQSI